MKNLLIITSFIMGVNQLLAQSNKIVPLHAPQREDEEEIIDTSSYHVEWGTELFWMPEGVGNLFFVKDSTDSGSAFIHSGEVKFDRLRAQFEVDIERYVPTYLQVGLGYEIPLPHNLAAQGGISYTTFAPIPLNLYPAEHATLFEGYIRGTYHYKFVYITSEMRYGWFDSKRLIILNPISNHHTFEPLQDNLSSVMIDVVSETRMPYWYRLYVRKYIDSPAIEIGNEAMARLRIGKTIIYAGVNFRYTENIIAQGQLAYGIGVKYTTE